MSLSHGRAIRSSDSHHWKQNSRVVTSTLEGIKGLIRRSEGLPDNFSQTEVNHYAAAVLSRLEHGDDIETLERYLRQLKTPGSRHFSPNAHNLAERALALFSSSHHDAKIVVADKR